MQTIFNVKLNFNFEFKLFLILSSNIFKNVSIYLVSYKIIACTMICWLYKKIKRALKNPNVNLKQI